MRKYLLLLPCFILFQTVAIAQYWQQKVDVTLDVNLDDKTNSLDGFEKINYTNHSPDTLHYIWFHLWPNAYKNDKTAFSDQFLENGSTRFYFSDAEAKGYINKLDFKVNNKTAETEDHPQHIDIIKVILPEPLPPESSVVISTPFHVKLPAFFSRSGYVNQSYYVTQWYPKPAVYDQNGWHPMPYLDQGEFYSEFGDYKVTITVPDNYVVAATGNLQEESEKVWLRGRANFNWEPVKEKRKTRSGIKTFVQSTPPSSTQQKTISFIQENVHDFAWFADKRFVVLQDTCRLSSGKTISCFSYFTNAEKESWQQSVAWLKSAVRSRSEWVGEYPYAVVSAVMGPETMNGGMEYPSITLVQPERNKNILHYTIAHEVSHNWFYSILGSNERTYPWMDEGLNTYYDNRYSETYIGKEGEITAGKETIALKNLVRLLFNSKAAAHKDQPIATSSEAFETLNYNITAYYKTGAWLEYLEEKIGKEAFDKAMQAYYQKWKFKHPSPLNFKEEMEKSSGQQLDAEFALLQKNGALPNDKRSGTAFGFLLNKNVYLDHLKVPSKNLVLIGPSLGYNHYDKLMPGLLLTNHVLPASPFQFFISPLYSTKAKKLSGLGRVSYSFYPKNFLQKAELSLAAARFSIDDFTSPDGNTLNMGLQKFAPSFTLTLKEQSSRSTIKKQAGLKLFLISEEQLRYRKDTIISGSDTTYRDVYGTQKTKFNIPQLNFSIENSRVLYPYRAELKIDKGEDFVRSAFTGNYYFNYVKDGGLNVRLFAGKFFHVHSENKFRTSRYQLNMTGANGYEDYTYSDYFIGRNEFEGWQSQQIMIRDGGFKIRTDLLSDKVGKTDDWLLAANFTTSIPKGINPLNILPVKIPLKIFADIGTQSSAWEKDSEQDKFLFDAGLQLSLLKEAINIYLPVLYSKVYKDYLSSSFPKKERLWKKISFSIDLSHLNPKKLSPLFNF